jgi:hypothetical protein
MNTRVDDSLSEDDGDDDKQKNTEYVAIVDEDESQDDRSTDDSQEDDGEDVRLSDDNEDREQIRVRRREEKAERAQRRKAAMERDKNELNYLRQVVSEQERRMRNLEHNTATQKFVALEQRIQEAAEEVKAAEYIISQAVNAGNGEDVAQAIRIRDEAIGTVKQLQSYKARAQQPVQQQQQQRQPQAETMSMKLAKDWAESNDWFDPNGGDEKSKKMLEIDKGLINEGYNPDNLEYWRELDKRAEQLNKRGRGGPPIGSGREHVSSAGRNEVYLSPERVDALKQLGVYGDKAAMSPYLKQYAKWDRENKSTR